MKRYAIIKGAASRRHLEAYLPGNYRVIHEYTVDDPRPSHNEGPDARPNAFVIEGKDDAGWTLDAYVIPRLASGLIWAQEIDLSHPVMKEVPA